MNERDLFIAVLPIEDAAERAAYLDRACASAAALRQRVEALLAAFAQAGSFLQQPAVDPRATTDLSHRGPSSGSDPTEEAGTAIGPYKLLEQIGEGGMGTVWMAQQTEPVKRLVAVKLIKAGMDSKQVLARFEVERQALALMDHAHIARVLDGGTTSAGRPFFVMDLVKGVPITKYCDEHHLTLRERLELFLPVCQAVQHAHQKGIIHRDLKPSNVLVALYDGRPVPKVIDFGVAKAAGQPLTEKTLVTGFGALVGTLEYMSPEQAEINQLDIDTRSDIYALGVLLYELLTGTTPLEQKWVKEAGLLEALRIIREEETPRPSMRLSTAEGLPTIAANRGTEPKKLAALFRGELDWIVMKALEKDRNRRYETANGFAMDVQRYLADEPVQACPPSAGYRLGKFARRNKVAIAFTGLVLLILLSLTGGIGWNVRDRAARQAAVEQEVNLAFKEAEWLQEQAKWPEALSAAKRAEGLLAGGGNDKLRDRAQQLRKEVDMVLRLAEIRLLSSEWKDHKFNYESVDRAYALAFDSYGIDVTGLPAEEAAGRIRAWPGIAMALVAALDEWAIARRHIDKAGGEALTAVAEAAESDPWRRRVREAAKQEDKKALASLAVSPDLLRQPPTSLLMLAGTLRQLHGLREAPIDLLRRAQRQYPGDFFINYELAVALKHMGRPYRDEAISFYRAAVAARPMSSAALNDLGVALRNQGKLDEAIAICRKAIELDPKIANAHDNIGLALKSQGELDEAIVWFKKAIELDPKNAGAYGNLGNAFLDQGKLEVALDYYRKAIELDPKYAIAHNNVGLVYDRQRKLDEAIDWYRKSIALDPKYAIAYGNLGAALFKLGKLDDAIAACCKAIELDPEDAGAHNNLGTALSNQGKLDEAIAAYRKAIELDPKHAIAHHNLGDALHNRKKLDQAIAYYKKALELNPKHVAAYNGLGLALSDQKQLDGAIAYYRKAIEIDPRYAVAYTNLGNTLHAQNKLDEAVAAHRKAVELDPKYAIAHNNLGVALGEQKKWDEAVAAYRKAIDLDPKDTCAYSNLGAALFKLGKWDEAVAAHRKAIELDPKNANEYSNLGSALAMQGKLDDAIAALRKGIELDPKNATFHRNLGVALRHQNKADEAIAAFRKAIELHPKFIDAYDSLGAILCDVRGEYENAAACFRKAIELNPKDVIAHHNLGVALRGQRKLDEAIAAFRKAVELDPKGANFYSGLHQALNSLAWTLATDPVPARRDPGRAVRAAREAVQLNPQNGNYHNTLGTALYRAGDCKAAIATLDKSMELGEGGNSFDWFFLAMAHWQLGEKDKARQWYDRAVQWMDKNQPKNEELRRFRAEAAELLGLNKKK
jgi:tetratricopeptide (TPR) repeat protein